MSAARNTGIRAAGGDLIALLIVGILGWLMKQFGWPRPAALMRWPMSGTIWSIPSVVRETTIQLLEKRKWLRHQKRQPSKKLQKKL